MKKIFLFSLILFLMITMVLSSTKSSNLRCLFSLQQGFLRFDSQKMKFYPANESINYKKLWLTLISCSEVNKKVKFKFQINDMSKANDTIKDERNLFVMRCKALKSEKAFIVVDTLVKAKLGDTLYLERRLTKEDEVLVFNCPEVNSIFVTLKR